MKSNSELYDKENQEAEDIPWNFAKFLVDADGNVLKYYEPSVDLDDIRSEIEELLWIKLIKKNLDRNKKRLFFWLSMIQQI